MAVTRFTGVDNSTLTWATVSPAAGDLIIVLFANDGGDNQTTPGGTYPLTKLDPGNNGTSVEFGAYYRIATGSESGNLIASEATFGVSGEEYTWHVFKVPAAEWHGTTPPELARAGGAGTTGTINPPELTPSWGSAETLWIVVAARDDDDGISSLGANYTTNFAYTESAATTGSCEIASSWRINAAASEDPGNATQTNTNEEYIAYTIGVRPPAAGGGGSPATITRVQSAFAQTNGGTSLGWGTDPDEFDIDTPTEGNLLVVAVNSGIFGGGSAGNPNAWSGWNLVKQHSSSHPPNSHISVYWRIVQSGDTATNLGSITWDNNSQRTGFVVEYSSSEGWPADPFDVASTGSDSSSTQTAWDTGSSGALAGPGSVGVAVLAMSGGSAVSGMGVTNSYSIIGSIITNAGGGASSNEIYGADLVDLEGTSATSTEFSWTGARDAAAVVVVFTANAAVAASYLASAAHVVTAASSSLTNSAPPQPEDGYLLLDGSGDYANVQSSRSAFGFNGDHEYRIDVAMDDWDDLAAMFWESAADLFVDGGDLIYDWVESDTTYRQALSGATPGGVFPNGQRVQFRVTHDIDNGSGQNVVTFYFRTGEDITDLADNSNWTQITQATQGFTTSYLTSTPSQVRLGNYSGGGYDWAGRVYGWLAYNGIGGTIYANPDFRTDDVTNWSSGGGNDAAGNNWVLNGDATWVPPVTAGETELSSFASTSTYATSSITVVTHLSSAAHISATTQSALNITTHLPSTARVVASAAATLDVVTHLSSAAQASTSAASSLDVITYLTSAAQVSTSTEASLDSITQLTSTAQVVASASAALSVAAEFDSAAHVSTSTAASLANITNVHLNSSVAVIAESASTVTALTTLTSVVQASSFAESDLTQVHALSSNATVIAAVISTVTQVSPPIGAVYPPYTNDVWYRATNHFGGFDFLTWPAGQVTVPPNELASTASVVAQTVSVLTLVATPVRELVGAAAVVTETSSDLTQIVTFSSVAQVTTSATGQLRQVHAPTAALSVVAQTRSAITEFESLLSCPQMVAQAIATLHQVHTPAATLAAVTESSGQLTQVHSLNSTASAIAATESSVHLAYRLQSTVSAVAESSATLHQVHAVQSSATAVTATTSTATQTNSLAAALSVVAAIASNLTKRGKMAATLSVVTESSAQIAQTHALAAESNVTTESSASLTAVVHLASSAATVTSALSTLSQVHTARSTAQAVTATESTFSTAAGFTSVAQVTAATESNLTQTHRASSAAAAVAATSSSLTRVHPLRSTAQVVSATSADLTSVLTTLQLSSTAQVVTATSATIATSSATQSAAEVVTSTASSLTQTHALRSVAQATSATSSSLSITASLRSNLAAVTATVAQITLIAPLFAAVESVAQTQGSLSQTNALMARLQLLAQVQAVLSGKPPITSGKVHLSDSLTSSTALSDFLVSAAALGDMALGNSGLGDSALGDVDTGDVTLATLALSDS